MVNMIYHGNFETCGAPSYNIDDNVTCALLAYKKWGEQIKEISNPNVVAFSSVHPRYEKACRNLDVEFRVAQALDINGLESLIDHNTVCIICSAPCNATGWIDPVKTMSKIAMDHSIGLHIDSAYGLLLPFVNSEDEETMADFRTQGVTSITVGLNNYAKLPPGVGVLLFRTKQLWRCTFFGYGQWPGGLYCTVGLVGSRSSSATAAAWTKI